MHIVPLVKLEDGSLHRIIPPKEKCDETPIDVLVSADMLGGFEIAPTPLETELGWRVEVILTTVTYHLYTSIFSPTVGEALGQIPDEYISHDSSVREIMAFRTIHEPPQPYVQKMGRTYRWARTEYYRLTK
jgi:hypothetical protein